LALPLKTTKLIHNILLLALMALCVEISLDIRDLKRRRLAFSADIGYKLCLWMVPLHCVADQSRIRGDQENRRVASRWRFAASVNGEKLTARSRRWQCDYKKKVSLLLQQFL